MILMHSGQTTVYNKYEKITVLQFVMCIAAILGDPCFSQLQIFYIMGSAINKLCASNNCMYHIIFLYLGAQIRVEGPHVLLY